MFLCPGILTGAWLNPGIFFICPAIILITFLVITDYVLKKSRRNILSGIAINTAFFLCGILLYSARKHSLSTLPGEKAEFICTLSDYPLEKENSILLRVGLVCMNDKDRFIPLKGSMLVYNRKDTTFTSCMPGDKLILRCRPTAITNRNNPYEFNYRAYMENRDIKYYALTQTRDITWLTPPKHRSIKCRALIIRRGIINMYRRLGIRGKNLAVVAAISLGQKNLLGEEQKNDFATAGVIHVMAVSGLHVMILSLFVMNVFFFLKKRFNIARIIITLVFMWMFAFITGLATPVIRASLMFTFIWSGYLMKRRLNPMNSLMASAFVLILIKPGVIFDSGFLLSYSAVIFIIVFYNDLYMKLHFRRYIPDKIWQMAVVAIVAQAATMPITITLFNRFPVYFLIANLIIVPLASLIVITGCLVPLVYSVRPLAGLLAAILNKITGLTILITEKTASLPHASITDTGMLPPECFLLMLTIFLCAFYLLRKRSIPVVYPLIALLLFVTFRTYSDIRVKTTREIIVYNIPRSTAIGIRTGRVLNLYSDSKVVSDEVQKHCSTLHLKLSVINLPDEPLWIGTGDKKILISRTGTREFNNDMEADIIVIPGRDNQVIYDICKKTGSGPFTVPGKSKLTIFSGRDTSCSYTGRVYSVGKSGAFIKRI